MCDVSRMRSVAWHTCAIVKCRCVQGMINDARSLHVQAPRSPVRYLGRKAVEASHDFEYARLVPSLHLEPSNPRRQQRRRWSTAGEVSSGSGSGSGSSSSSSRLAQQQQQRRQGRSSFSGAAAAAAAAASASAQPQRDAKARSHVVTARLACTGVRVHVSMLSVRVYVCVCAPVVRDLRQNVILAPLITKASLDITARLPVLEGWFSDHSSRAHLEPGQRVRMPSTSGKEARIREG